MINPSISIQTCNKATVTVNECDEAGAIVDQLIRDGQQVQVGVFIGDMTAEDMLENHQRLLKQLKLAKA